MEPTLEDIMNLSEITDDPVVPVWEAAKGKGRQTQKFSTDIPLLDTCMDGGVKDGDLVIVSGISGEGKTSFMETLTYNFINQGLPCLWFSYEIPVNKLNERFVRMGLQENSYEAFCPKKNTTGKLYWVKHKIQESYFKHATKIVFIDMIDNLAPSDIKTTDNETIALKKITLELKQMALELGIIIIVSAHITKIREGEEAGMQNIAWSAGVYQLADFVIMITRERIQKKRTMGQDNNEDIVTNNAFVKIVKNRETGILKKIKCHYEQFKFREITTTREEPNIVERAINVQGIGF